MSAPLLVRRNGTNKPDIGTVKPPTPQQLTDAATYIARHDFDDESVLLAMLGLDQL